MIYFIIHSNRFFSLNQGIFSFYLLFKTLGHKGYSFILCATEMKSWGREKKKPCPKFPFKSVKCEKTSSKVHSVTVARKSVLQGQLPRPSAVAQSLPHPQWIIRKNPRRMGSTWGMEFLIVLPCDYHEHVWTQLFPFWNNPKVDTIRQPLSSVSTGPIIHHVLF